MSLWAGRLTVIIVAKHCCYSFCVRDTLNVSCTDFLYFCVTSSLRESRLVARAICFIGWRLLLLMFDVVDSTLCLRAHQFERSMSICVSAGVLVSSIASFCKKSDVWSFALLIASIISLHILNSVIKLLTVSALKISAENICWRKSYDALVDSLTFTANLQQWWQSNSYSFTFNNHHLMMIVNPRSIYPRKFLLQWAQ